MPMTHVSVPTYEIEKLLNKNFKNVRDWFIDSKINMLFADDKTKSILLVSKRKIKSARKIKITYKNKTLAGYISWLCFR